MWPIVTDVAWSVCVCVCLLDITINSAKTDDQDVIGSRDLSGPCVRWGPGST